MVKKKRNNNIIIDGINFDSPEEVEVYSSIMSGTLHKLTGDDSLMGVGMINPRPEGIELCKGFKAGKTTIRGRKYTYDFDIEIRGLPIALEVKSKWTEAKPDYRLRRFLFLFFFHKNINFMEIIKIKKGVFNVKKYYD